MNPARTPLFAIGAVLFVVSVVTLSFIGVYPGEAPLYFGILLAGSACIYAGSKMKKRVDEDDEADEGSNDIVA